MDGTATRSARSQADRAPRRDADAALSKRAAYGTAALVGFVLGNALLSVARHRSVAGALLLMITILGGLLLLLGNEEAIAKRGFRSEAVDLPVAAGLFSVLLFVGVVVNAVLLD